MSTITELTTHSLDDFTSSSLSLVYFWTSWCKSCKEFSPAFEELSREYSDRAKFIKVNADEHPQLAEQHQLVGYPAVLFFREGQLIDKVEGAVTKFRLRDRIKVLLE